MVKAERCWSTTSWPSGLATRAATSTRTPETGKPYTNIRKLWDWLIAIASDMLGYSLVNENADFFTFRHTGAANIAQMASNREELMRVVNMMGDTNVETLRRHYFNFKHDEDDQVSIGGSSRRRSYHPASPLLMQPGSSDELGEPSQRRL